MRLTCSSTDLPDVRCGASLRPGFPDPSQSCAKARAPHEAAALSFAEPRPRRVATTPASSTDHCVPACPDEEPLATQR
jgi:hypothetical protein